MMRIIGGKWKRLFIATSKSINYRPITSSLRTSFFDFLGNSISGCTFLDGFAGTGILGIEALSRGASSVVFIEKNAHAASLIKRNIEYLKADASCKIIVKELEKVLSKKIISSSFDIIFLDPPFSYPKEKIESIISSIIANELLTASGIIAARYQKYKGKLPLQINSFELIKEFRESEAYLDVYQK